MADGNLGSLWFQLGLKDNTSKELQKIIDKLKTGDDAANALLRALQGFGTKKSGFKEQAEKAKEFSDVLLELNRRISKLRKNDKGDEAKDLQTAVKNALSYLDMLQKINIERSKISELRSLNPNVDTSKLREAEVMLENVNSQLLRLQGKPQGGGGGGVDQANVLQDYSKVLQMTLRDVKRITDQFKKENPLSAFSGGAAKVEADIARVTEKLAKMRDLMSEGTTKGYNTSMLGGSLVELDKVLSRLQAASGNKSILTDAAQMKNLLSDVAVEMTKATSATQAYGREKGKVIAQERADNAVLEKYEKAQSNEYTRKQKQQAQYLEQLNREGLALQKNAEIQQKLAAQQEKAWISQTKSGFRGGRYLMPENERAAQGYRDIANAYQTSANQLQAKYNEDKANFSKQLDEYAKLYKTIEDKLRAISPNMDGRGIDGKGLKGKDRSYYEGLVRDLGYMKNDAEAKQMANISDLEAQAQKIKELIRLVEKYNQLAESASKATYKPYNASSYEQKRVSETAALKNAIIERAKAEEKAEKDRKKNAAEAKADEKQRQNEIEITKRRIQSLTYAMEKLQGKVSEGQSLKVDTSKAEAKVKSLEQEIQSLRVMQSNLEGAGWKAYLGDVGQFGNGRSVREANHLAQEQAAANREAQKGIEIEQKRQAEIAKSAAKVQSDLVRGFERANNHAGKLNSTVQDLKSLFLQGGLVFGAQQFAMSIITTGGEMEKQHIALQSILGDMQNANTMFYQIKELALNSPFTFSELNRDVKQLAAYGVEYDQLYDTTKRLADMSSGLGVSFDRIALAFGQVQARGWLDGKELRQIAYAGIPLLNKLSEFYSKQEGRNVSTSEIKTRISNRDVSFDDVKSIFWQMTNEGGQFYNMQQTLSETLLGRYNKLKDAWEIMLAYFANGNSLVGSFFKTAIEGATALVQSLHSLAMPVGTIFAGYVLKKMLAGNTASSFLSNKANIASNIESRVLQGQQVSQIEQRILATKNQIAGADLRALANAKALTTEKLNQLRLSGQITAEQYNTYRGIVLRQTGEAGVLARLKMTLASMRQITATSALASLKSVWPSFATSALASFRIIGTGIKSMASTVWTAIGGLPGLIVTALTLGITSAISSYQELSQKIKQTQDEIADKNNQISKFLQDNNVAVTIAGGDTKEIDNMIDSYKDKLKELAPYSYKNMLMTADEKKSHVERLKYLEQEVKLLREANDVANSKMSNRGFYSDLEDVTKDAYEKLENRLQMRTDAMAPNASQGDKDLYANEKAYGDFIEKLKDTLEKKFGDIGKDEKIREAAMQSMNAIFSEMGVPEDKAEIIRSSVLQAFGCGEKSTWLQSEVSSSMIGLIDKSFPMIGEKIKASLPLTEAEQAKVKELMKDAKNGLINQYPELEQTLKRMLAESNFEAVIKLVFDTGDKLNDVQSTLVGRIPSMIDPNSSLGAKYRKRAEEYGKDNSWYKGSNLSNQRIDDAKNEWQSAVKRHAPNVKEIYQNYLDEMTIARTLLYNYYKGEGKKSNKPGKKNSGGRKEDTELKNLQERLNSLKSARQMYQKYQTIMSDDEAKEKTLKLFPEVTGLNLNDYQKAVRELLKGFKINTSERKKFQTSIYREVAEWIFSEKDKKAFDEKAATFNEEMNKLSERWDLYKTLLEKTGNKNFAESSWIDAFQMDEKTKSLMDEWYAHYGEVFNLEDSLKLTDGQAKERFKKADQYNEWKKIVDLLRGNYVKSLQDGAEAISQTMAIAQKLDVITNKYNEKRKNAGDDQGLIDRYNYLEKQEKSGVLFDQLKSEINWDGVFGNLGNYTKKELRKIRKQIRDLVAGGIIDGMSTTDLKSFYDGMEKLNQAIDGQGFSGLSDLIREMVDASQKYDEATKEYNEAVAKYGNNSWQAEAARKKMQEAEDRKRRTTGSVRTKKETRLNNILTVADMFKTLGMSNGSGSTFLSNAGGWTESLMNMFGGDKAQKNSSKIGSIVGMFAGLTEAINEKGFGGFLSDAFEDIGGATNSIFKDLFGLNLGINGADYSDYNKAKAEYENLVNIWDTLISKKKTYLSEHWGTEAQNASKEAMALLKSEIEQAKVIAKNRLGSGASIGSHSVGYRMWKGSYDYNGTNWRDVAGEISSKYGVQFNGMEDMLNMAPKVLEGIKTDFSGLWANMDSDFRDYLDKLIEYGDQVDEMEESLTEKLTGNKFSDLVSSWGDAMSSMANSSDNLVDHFEDNLKKTILNSMIENIYGDKIKALISKTKKYAENDDKITDSNGKTISEYTGTEYSDVKESTEDLAKQIEATRDFLKKTYGWSDNSSSSSTNSVKGITEETADIIVSYLNAMRLDLSVNRDELKTLSDFIQAKLPELSVIAQSQLTQLNVIAQNTLRNADSAERIESMLNSVINGVKRIRVS